MLRECALPAQPDAPSEVIHLGRPVRPERIPRPDLRPCRRMDDLRAYFGQFGTVTDVYLPRDMCACNLEQLIYCKRSVTSGCSELMSTPPAAG